MKDSGELQASAALTPNTHWSGGRFGPTVFMEGFEKKSLAPAGIRTVDNTVQWRSYRIDWAILVVTKECGSSGSWGKIQRFRYWPKKTTIQSDGTGHQDRIRYKDIWNVVHEKDKSFSADNFPASVCM